MSSILEGWLCWRILPRFLAIQGVHQSIASVVTTFPTCCLIFPFVDWAAPRFHTASSNVPRKSVRKFYVLLSLIREILLTTTPHGEHPHDSSEIQSACGDCKKSRRGCWPVVTSVCLRPSLPRCTADLNISPWLKRRASKCSRHLILVSTSE